MIYFDNAATSFQKPDQVYRRMYDVLLHHSANPGRGGHQLSIRAGEILDETRELAARLFHIETPERIVFCPNTTFALNEGIKGVLKEGDHVVISSMEHNSVLRPIEELRRRNIISYTIVEGNPHGEISPESISNAIRPNTALIVLTHASNVCGNIFDVSTVARSAHERGILFCVDAAQSAGILDLDASCLDLLAFPGHKGLMGPQGSGGLYVREGISPSTIIEGGTGSSSELYYQPDEFPNRLESGTQNVAAVAGLGEGIRFILRETPQAIRQKEAALCDYFSDAIRNIDGISLYGTKNKENHLAVTALNLDGVDCVEVADWLDREEQIATRAGLHCSILAHETLGTKKIGCVRFSFGYFNTKREVDRAIYALYRLRKMHK